jgi:hypothetical protein
MCAAAGTCALGAFTYKFIVILGATVIVSKGILR